MNSSFKKHRLRPYFHWVRKEGNGAVTHLEIVLAYIMVCTYIISKNSLHSLLVLFINCPVRYSQLPL